jgi:hypothetical protein
MKIKFLPALAIAGLLLSGCAAKVAYTTEIQEKYSFTEEGLKKIQFYLAGDIVLFSSSSDGSTKTEGGKLVISEDKSVNRVIIKRGTHGVLERYVDKNTIVVRFDQGEGKYLTFASTSQKGAYRLKPDQVLDSGRGKLKYGGENYECSKGSREAFLEFKLKKTSNYKSQQKVAKGVRVQ